ncbi:hypothetical protein CNEO4_120054 [Clostridium neonatale]|nr:hypothetical protein CNEO4_120054 [Clostridium neonatale]
MTDSMSILAHHTINKLIENNTKKYICLITNKNRTTIKFNFTVVPFL